MSMEGFHCAWFSTGPARGEAVTGRGGEKAGGGGEGEEVGEGKAEAGGPRMCLNLVPAWLEETLLGAQDRFS